MARQDSKITARASLKREKNNNAREKHPLTRQGNSLSDECAIRRRETNEWTYKVLCLFSIELAHPHSPPDQ